MKKVLFGVATAAAAIGVAGMVKKVRETPFEADAEFTWQTVMVDGNEIHYRVAGPVDAPPMIHQHGFAISGTYMLPTAARLTDAYRVYVPDLPGFGRSPRPAAPLTIEGLGTALNNFMTAIGVDQAVVVGNSLGCAITAELIAEAPEKVSKAVLVSLAGGRHNRPLARAVAQMARDGLVEPPTLLPVAVPDYLGFGMIGAFRLFDAMTKFPAYERLMSIPVPTMVVIGSEDPIRPSWRDISAALAALPPQVTIVLLQGAAHAINFTNPAELSHAIRQYLADEPIRMDAGNPTSLPVLQLQRPA